MTAPPGDWFTVVFWATLLSTGGLGNLPALHHETVTARHWATPQQIAEALALGQVCPGPNGLWVVCLGYLIGGVVGGVLAAVAVALPPFLIIPVERAYRRVSGHPHIAGFVSGLGLAVVGIGFVILGRVFASGGVTPGRVAVAVFAALLMASRRVPFPVILGVAAAVGLLIR